MLGYEVNVFLVFTLTKYKNQLLVFGKLIYLALGFRTHVVLYLIIHSVNFEIGCVCPFLPIKKILEVLSALLNRVLLTQMIIHKRQLPTAHTIEAFVITPFAMTTFASMLITTNRFTMLP